MKFETHGTTGHALTMALSRAARPSLPLALVLLAFGCDADDPRPRAEVVSGVNAGAPSFRQAPERRRPGTSGAAARAPRIKGWTTSPSCAP